MKLVASFIKMFFVLINYLIYGFLYELWAMSCTKIARVLTQETISSSFELTRVSLDTSSGHMTYSYPDIPMWSSVWAGMTGVGVGGDLDRGGEQGADINEL